MAIVAYILLAHESHEQVGELVRVLTSADATCSVVVHYDANAPMAEWEKLREAFSTEPRVHLVQDRVRCGWGQFGLVDGVVRALRLVHEKNIDHTHAYLISGSCMPVRPLAELTDFLDDNPDIDFIQSHDKTWILDGLREERYEYRFPFNFQKQKWFFRRTLELQRAFKLKRPFPKGLEPRFGSQWWCLTRTTCEQVLDWVNDNPKSYAFFRDMWIPDECFFQTIVFHVANRARIRGRLLTYYQFNRHGKPLVFHDGHEEHLARVSYFFARKISSRAHKLRTVLADIASRPKKEGSLTAFSGEPTTFPLARLVKEQSLYPKAGQLYREDQIDRGLPAVLGSVSTGFAVIYGPPALTQPVAAALREKTGITVFGRLFAEGEVDFGPGVSQFHGLKRTDGAIRDLDCALYLTRILERCPDFAVFELCPGENLELEANLVQSETAVLLSLLPEQRTPLAAKLLQLFGVPANERRERVEFLESTGIPLPIHRVLDELLETTYGIEHPGEIRLKLVGNSPLPGTHYWGGYKAPEITDDWKSAIALLHGTAGQAFIDALPAVQDALTSAGPQAPRDSLEPYWRTLFIPASGRTS